MLFRKGFRSADFFFRTLAVGDVHYRSNELEFAQLISFSVSHDVNVFDGAIRHHQAIFMPKILSILGRAFNCLSHRGRIFRMNPLVDKFHGCYGRSVVSKDSKSFV
jgi:hypothetical protein